jgi:hypothetical protein
MANDVIDLKDFDRLAAKLEQLSNKGKKKLRKDTLASVGRVLVKEAKKNLKSSFLKKPRKKRSKNGTRRKIVAKKKSQKGDILSGIKYRVWRSLKGVVVNILGNKKTKWFEKGTKMRSSKGGRNRGKMTATYFFKKAVEAKKTNSLNEINKDFFKYINKIWNKENNN